MRFPVPNAGWQTFRKEFWACAQNMFENGCFGVEIPQNLYLKKP
jgi:hypothetical protein